VSPVRRPCPPSMMKLGFCKPFGEGDKIGKIGSL